MITQSINLNLISGQVLPRVNASQYDSNTRTLNMYLYDGELTFNIPNGVSGYIQGTKPDRTGFQYAATVTTGSNVVTFDVTEQMTAVAGEVVCELVLVEGSDRIATVNFILFVERAALSDDTIISETELPLIEEAAELGQQIDGFIEQMDADAAKSEAFGAGTVNGVPVTSDNPAYENNAKYYSDEAAASASSVGQLKEDSEAYAVGTRGGVPVTSGDVTYHNNAKYYANAASGSASTAVASDIAAAQSKEDAEAWAVGEREGAPVSSGDVTYENNSKYYAGEAADSASNASTSETNAGLSESAAAQSKEDAEAWANGTRGGVPVSSGDAAYHNNAKHWAGEASGTVNDMVGATASADGVHGLVPQPLMGDQNKFLGGDGNWKNLPVSNRNLLDNPWFTVNQRGLNSYSGAAQYAVDRWFIMNNKGELTINSDGSITVAANGGDTWLQNRINPDILKALVGKTITLSIDAVKTGGYVNLYSGYYDSTNTWHRISNDTGINTTRSIVSETTVVPALVDNNPKFAEYGIYIANGQSVTIYSTKLEVCNYSTLANDVAPNYAEELAKCQRYFVRLEHTSLGMAICNTVDYFDALVNIPVPMRTVPSVTYNGTIGFALSNNITRSGIESISVWLENPITHVGCSMKKTGATIGEVGRMYATTNSYIDLTADL